MKTLPKNWLTEGLIDFEFKKYQLLAYLKEAEKEFQSVKVHPTLGDLIEHYRLLKDLRSGKTELKNLFPKALNGIDFQNQKLTYHPIVKEGKVIEELEQITDFAIPKLYRHIKEGENILEFVENQIEFEPVGIQPLYNREGYLLVTQERNQDVMTFRYRSNYLQMANEKFKNISFWFIGIFKNSWFQSLEKLKMHLVNEIKELPNPATWRLHSAITFPIEETLIPVGKKLLLEKIRE